MAQAGSSCSNPYVINLVNGISDNNFNLTNLDSIVYIKIGNVLDKVNLTISMDTSNSDFGVCNLDVLKNNSCINVIADDYFTIFKDVVDYTFFSSNDDTVLLKIKVCDFTNFSTNTTISFNLKINTSQLNSMGGSCAPEFCDNLVFNASLEQFVIPTSVQNNGQSYSDNLCGWENIYAQSYYFNPWYDNINCPPLLGQALCNGASVTNSNSISCGYPPQQSNAYFNQNTAYGGLVFGDNIISTLPNGNTVWMSQGILRVELNSALVNNTAYYVEANIAKKYSSYYGSRLDFDISANPNYISTQYPNNFIPSLSTAGIDFNPNLEWTKINTIYTTPSTGGPEQFMFIGNLKKAPLNPIQTQFNNSLGCFNTNQVSTYFFDNLVVKKFFADAGPAAFTACEELGVKIQPSSCPLQNAIYSWTPANYFDDPSSPNPIFTAPTGSAGNIIQVTLTVTLEVNNGVIGSLVTYSTSSTVDITVTTGSSITITGSTTVQSGGSTTLDLTNGTNFSWTGSDGTSGFSASNTSIFTGSLTQDVTYTINATSSSGCSVTEVVTVTVTPLPPACINDPNYPNTIIIPDGTDYNAFLNILGLTQGLTNYNIINTNFALAGTFTIDLNTPLSFTSCHFYCYDKASFYNQSGDVVLRNCTLEACNNVLWKGINNEGKLAMSYCLVKDARDGILIAPQTKNFITGNTFRDNYIGINIFGDCIFSNQNNKFSNPNPLLPHWLGWNLPQALCGIRISDATAVSIDVLPLISNQFTEFSNINCGVLGFNTDITVNNAYFENIYDHFGVTNNINGSGISVHGTSANRLEVLPFTGIHQTTTFKDCNIGIFHEGYNSRLFYLGMQNVERGIVGEQLAYCTNWMEYNRINANSYGIEMMLIDDVELFVINHNEINMNSDIARGISVSAFDNNTSQGSNIKIQDNEIHITNGVYGIEVNSVFHPKVNMNKIYHSLVAPINVFNYWKGINTTNCNKADISCNDIEVGTGLAQGNSGADIYLAQSPGTNLACNTTNGQSPTGIFLSSQNPGSKIQTNEIGSHNIGLYLDNSCLIGPQPAQGGQPHGNKWNGTYNNVGAMNENIWDNTGTMPVLGFSTIEFNRFRIDDIPNNYPFYPENYPDYVYNYNSDPTDNTDWFVQDNLFPTLDPCTGGYCPHLENDGGDEENPNMGLNTSIALGLIQITGYPEETKWMLRKGLITELSRNDSLLNANDTMQVFYFGINQDNLKKLQKISDTIAVIKLINEAILLAMQGNDSIMNLYNDAMQVLLPMMDDSLLTDSISPIYEQIHNQYKIIADMNQQLSDQLNSQRNEAGVQGLMLNVSILPNNFNEYLERQVNDIYLRTYGQGVDTLSTSDIATLQYLIHICPQAGGPSIYKARALYMMVNDTITYNDSVVCRNAGYFRESQELLMPELKTLQKDKSFNVFPNPGKDYLKIMLKGNNEDGEVVIYSATGTVIKRLILNKDVNIKDLDISQWAEGYYLIKYTSPNYQNQTKFIKLK